MRILALCAALAFGSVASCKKGATDPLKKMDDVKKAAGASADETAASDASADDDLEEVEALGMQLLGSFDTANSGTSAHLYYPAAPGLLCADGACGVAPWFQGSEASLTLTFTDAKDQTPIANESFTLALRNGSSSETVYSQSGKSDASGKWSSGIIAYARGLNYKICMSGQSKIRVEGGKLVVREFGLDETGCHTGQLNIAKRDTTVANAALTLPAETQLDAYELITTGSYCPTRPMIVTPDQDKISAGGGLFGLGLSFLGLCKKLDTVVVGAVIDFVSGSPIPGAMAQVILAPESPQSLGGSYATGADGRFVSQRFTRFRGKNARVCAAADGYASACTEFDLSAAERDNKLTIPLYANKRPFGSVALTESPDAQGNFSETAAISGFVVDPDHEQPISIRVATDVTTIDPNTCEKASTQIVKDFITDAKSQLACSAVGASAPGICVRDVGFSKSLAELGLHGGRYVVTVSAINPANAPQPASEYEYIGIKGSPFVVNFKGEEPAPFCGAITYTLDPKTFAKQGMGLALRRILKDEREIMTVRLCEDKGGALPVSSIAADPQTCIVQDFRGAPPGCMDKPFTFDAGTDALNLGVTGLKAGTKYVAFVLPQDGRAESVAPARFLTPGKAPAAKKPVHGVPTIALSSNGGGAAKVALSRSTACVATQVKLTMSCTLKKEKYSRGGMVSLPVGEVGASTMFDGIPTGAACTITPAATPKAAIKAVKFTAR